MEEFMKKLLTSIVIVLFIGSLFAVESDPSDVVGYVEYALVTTAGTNSNFLAVPMDTGLTSAAGLGADIGVCDVVSKWDATNQGWVSCSYVTFPFPQWIGDFTIAPGDPLMVNVTGDVSYYVAGDLPTAANYTLVTTAGTNSNAVMLPLDQGALATADAIGTDIGVCDVVSKWDATNQGWVSCSYVTFPFPQWIGSFATAIGDPLMVNVTSGTAWPTPMVMGSTNTQTKIEKNLNKQRK
jgi:hypothetical protein